MLYRPSTLSAADQGAFEEHADACRERMLDHVETLVERVPPPGARPVYELAFSPSEALPKRDRRPKLDTVILIEAVAEALDLPASDRDRVVRMTILTQEYFDIVDDIVDGDVAEGRTAEALIVSQLLVALTVEAASRLGPDAVAYWSYHAQTVLCAPFVEARKTPGAETYLELLDRQAGLYAVCTGVAAVVAGADDSVVERYERIGATVCKHRQVVLDYEQTGDGTWNAGQLFDETTLVETLARFEQTVTDLVSDLPDRPAGHIRGLVALDVPRWREAVEKMVDENPSSP